MAFFQNSPETLEKLVAFRTFDTLDGFLQYFPPLVDAEESEFSHYYFSENDAFTFIAVEGMIENYDYNFVSELGTFYSPMTKEDMTPARRKRLMTLIQERALVKTPLKPMLEPDAVEVESKVHTDGYDYPDSLWFEKQHATWISLDWNQTEREQKTVYARHVPGGPIMQRLEWRERHLMRDEELVIDECLYKHYQVEKHQSESSIVSLLRPTLTCGCFTVLS